MTYAILAFVIFFLLAATGLLLAFYREALGRRLASVLASGVGPAVDRRPKTADNIAALADRLQKFLPQNKQQLSLARTRLILAGYREDWHVSAFHASRYVLPLLLAAAVVLTGLSHAHPVMLIVIAVASGSLAPKFWLNYRVKRRQHRVRVGLPDVLDFLVVCLEAGLSMDQAVMRAGEEMRTVHPAMADELSLVTLDLRGGRSRVDSWKALAERTEVDTVRMLVSILNQADMFGTGISKTLRVHADTLRMRRRQRAEELAAKTTIKMVFPLVLFIFPSLFVVILGPAVILVTETLAQMKN